MGEPKQVASERAGVPRAIGLGLGQGEQVRTPFGRSEELGEPKQVGSEDAGVPRQRGLGLGRDGGLSKCLSMSGDHLVFPHQQGPIVELW